MDDHKKATEQTPTDQPPKEERPLPLGQEGEGETMDDPVDDASDNSFPASDPPSFTGTTTD